MTDLNKLRSEFESDFAEHLIERDASGFYINNTTQIYWEKHLLKSQIKELKAELEKAKAQAVPDTHIVVPKVANKKMVNAGYEAHDGFYTNGQVQDVYQAMIKASESGAEG